MNKKKFFYCLYVGSKRKETTTVYYIELLRDFDMDMIGYKIYDLDFKNIICKGFVRMLKFDSDKVQNSLEFILNKEEHFDTQHLVDYTEISQDIFEYLKLN